MIRTCALHKVTWSIANIPVADCSTADQVLCAELLDLLEFAELLDLVEYAELHNRMHLWNGQQCGRLRGSLGGWFRLHYLLQKSRKSVTFRELGEARIRAPS